MNQILFIKAVFVHIAKLPIETLLLRKGIVYPKRDSQRVVQTACKNSGFVGVSQGRQETASCFSSSLPPHDRHHQQVMIKQAFPK